MAEAPGSEVFSGRVWGREEREDHSWASAKSKNNGRQHGPLGSCASLLNWTPSQNSWFYMTSKQRWREISRSATWMCDCAYDWSLLFCGPFFFPLTQVDRRSQLPNAWLGQWLKSKWYCPAQVAKTCNTWLFPNCGTLLRTRPIICGLALSYGPWSFALKKVVT